MRDHRASETACEKTIVQAGMVHGWLVHGSRASMTAKGDWATALKGHRGFVDLVLSRPPQTLFVELKRAPNTVEPDQALWHAALAASGLDVRVIWVPEEMQAFIDNVLPRPRKKP